MNNGCCARQRLLDAGSDGHAKGLANERPVLVLLLAVALGVVVGLKPGLAVRWLWRTCRKQCLPW